MKNKEEKIAPKISPNRGIASLPMILLLGGIIVEAALAGGLVLYHVSGDVYKERLSAQTALLARAAIDDGIMRVIQNPHCGIDVSGCPTPYEIIVPGVTVTVSICKDTCPGQGVNTTQITSVATSRGVHHSMIATLTVSSTLPLITLESIVDTP